MSRMRPRVALFADSVDEGNTVAHFSRNYLAFAQRHSIPMLCVRPGARSQVLEQVGEQRTLELARSGVSLPIEREMRFDLLFLRHVTSAAASARGFRPDVIHITGPSEIGLLGAIVAHRLGVPLVASWHTNVPQYAVRRVQGVTSRLGSIGPRIDRAVGDGVFSALMSLYRRAQVLFAPNDALAETLWRRTGRPAYPLGRGVDFSLFGAVPPAIRSATATPQSSLSPSMAQASDQTAGLSLAAGAADTAGELVLGYVGRLSVEKNVSALPRISAALRVRGIPHRWVIVGSGPEEGLLRFALGDTGEFRGFLTGEPLAEAFRAMDLLVLPSEHETFGNVVLEAFAAGVPAIVTPNGGLAALVQEGVTGRVLPVSGFADAIAEFAARPAAERLPLREAAHRFAAAHTWDDVFNAMLARYPVASDYAAPERSTAG